VILIVTTFSVKLFYSNAILVMYFAQMKSIRTFYCSVKISAFKYFYRANFWSEQKDLGFIYLYRTNF